MDYTHIRDKPKKARPLGLCHTIDVACVFLQKSSLFVSRGKDEKRILQILHGVGTQSKQGT